MNILLKILFFQSLTGKVKIDFKDEKAVRVLAKCLLKKDFELDVDFPPNHLVPTLPLRLNYILWIEDILKTFNFDETIQGFDIGCGGSCIYPLLCAQKFKWKMIGTEINEKNIKFANENVENNGLCSLIKIYKQEKGDKLFKYLTEVNTETKFDFSMCNPPFFGSSDEFDLNRTGNRNPPRGPKTGNSDEILVDGGEVEFVTKMIEESFQLKDRIKIYTSMLGKRSSLTQLKNIFKEKGVTNFISTEFCQGRTTRWGIAWTFCTGFYLNKVPQFIRTSGYRQGGHCVSFTFPQTDTLDFDRVEEIIDKLFLDLKLQVTLNEREPNAVIWEARASENTWSHQRRKRREMLRKEQDSSSTSEMSSTIPSDGKKQRLESETEPFLIFSARLKLEEPDIRLEVGYLEGMAGKDAANQILQYVKNNFKKFEPKSDT